MMMRLGRVIGVLLGIAAAPAMAQQSGEQTFRDIYRELIETNTTLSSGSCTLAAERMAARLKAAGFRDRDVQIIASPEHPKNGSLFAVLEGTDYRAKAILLLAHLDVVEAKREDWQRDPFTLVEENGYFYGRGTSDDKAQAAIWIDTFVRLKQEGFRASRTLKLALTCGEESVGAFNGADDLSRNNRELIDAEFALNEGAGGLLDAAGNPVVLNIQAGEKLPQDYSLEISNPGGHSSRPVRDNAIYRLSDALTKLRDHDFPVQANKVTIDYFRAMAKLVPPDIGAAMAAFATDPTDVAAADVIAAADPQWNALLRTTCVATMVDAGHAVNALPQRARANVNCRLLPGVSPEKVKDALVNIIADPQVGINILPARSREAPPPPLGDDIMGPARKIAAQIFPGTVLVPIMATGGTDAAFLTPAGIPTYGITGFFVGSEGSFAHGLNERMRVKSLLDGRNFLFALVKAYLK